ncbi:MAG: ABC transporter permease [Spirochaetales bacterium]|nr:ABC transporter permease [Spirochaetales bacterium]
MLTKRNRAAGARQGQRISDELALLIVFLTIIALVAAVIPRFRTVYNLLSVVRQFSIITYVSLGETVVLICGGFDLSVGSIAGLAGIFAAHMMVTLGWPVWLSVVIGVLIGVVCGFINGVLISKVKIQPLITTLATSWIYTGIILVTTKGWPVANLPESFDILGQGYLLGIPLPIIWLVLLSVLAWLFLSQTHFGRFIYATGGNEKAARLSGLNVDRIRIMAFTICGALAAFAGVVLASRMGSAQANAGVEWPLPAIAAAVIGGVSLAGGKGTVYGVLIGAALLGVINNILVLLHISAYWQSLISGFIVLAAVSIDAVRKYRESLLKSKIIQPERAGAGTPSDQE